MHRPRVPASRTGCPTPASAPSGSGDVIFPGTPGVTPAMKPGDTFEVEIPGVARLRNTVVAARP